MVGGAVDEQGVGGFVGDDERLPVDGEIAGDRVAESFAAGGARLWVGCAPPCSELSAGGRQLSDKRNGRILIVSSVSATTPTPYEGVYGGTKAFGYSLAETLREELREHGVSVTALLPGATDTNFHGNAGMGADTPIGRLTKFPKDEVARLGYEGLMAGHDMAVGGGDELREIVERNRITPRARQGRRTRPAGTTRPASRSLPVGPPLTCSCDRLAPWASRR